MFTTVSGMNTWSTGGVPVWVNLGVVVLLEEACHWRSGFENLRIWAISSSLSASCLWFKMWTLRFLSLLPCLHATLRDSNPMELQTQTRLFLLWDALTMAFNHSNRKVTNTQVTVVIRDKIKRGVQLGTHWDTAELCPSLVWLSPFESLKSRI